MGQQEKYDNSSLLEHLLNISRRMAEIHDLDDLLVYAIDQVLQLVGAEQGYIVLINKNNTLDFRVQREVQDAETKSLAETTELPENGLQGDPISYSILDRVLQTGQPIVVEDALFDPKFQSAASVMAMRLRSIMCAPLITQSRIIGAIYVENRTEAGRFVDTDITPLEFFCNQAAVAIENANLYTNLELLVAERTEALIQAKTEAEQARETAEAANQAKSQFLTNMSHELRTPLNSILGFAQILQRQTADPEIGKRLQMIQQSSKHLLTLINDILNLSKIEARRLELHPRPVHLHIFLKNIVGIIRDRAEAKDLLLVYEADETLPAGVQADETRLRQVLLNLLGNAVKFTDAGQVTLRVKRLDRLVTTGQPNPQTLLRFEVIDSGVGLASNQIEQAFQPFEQVGDVSRYREGTGLGLPISRQLIQLMGSDIQVESMPGQGSRFWFDLALPLTTSVTSPDQPARVVTYKGDDLRILVVDDITLNRSTLVDMLQLLGFETLEAEDGRQAIQLAQETHPDLIFMDRRMPVMHGLEAIQRLRQLPELQRTPIISVSASVSVAEQAELMAAGSTAFLSKPINWADLMAQLEEHLPVERVYEDVEVEVAMTETEIRLPPQADLEALVEIGRSGNIAQVEIWTQELIARDARYQALVNKLSHLAENYEIEQITQLALQYLKKRNDNYD